jgi:hypothetical protein
VIIVFECAVTGGGEPRPDGDETVDARFWCQQETAGLSRCRPGSPRFSPTRSIAAAQRSTAVPPVRRRLKKEQTELLCRLFLVII